MKKILVALAIAAYASTSFAAVENSKHDFNANATYSVGLASRCQYCHVPHAAKTWANVALWATDAATGGTFEYYSNTDTKVTSASPIINAAAVEAVREGARMAFSRASLPGAPPKIDPGEPTRRASGRTKCEETSATAMKKRAQPAASVISLSLA